MKYDGVCWEVRSYDLHFFERVLELSAILLQFEEEEQSEQGTPEGQSVLEQFRHVEHNVDSWDSDDAGIFDPTRHSPMCFILLVALFNEFSDTDHQMSLAYENRDRSNDFDKNISSHANYLKEMGHDIQTLRPALEATGLILPSFSANGLLDNGLCF